MKSICFFNNKGGVGKTTLATNIASCLATNHNRKVLVVDLDPQCNTTQLLLPEAKQEELFQDGHGKGTILEVIKPLRFGESRITGALPIIAEEENGFNVSLIAGHPGLSLFEDDLSQSWTEMTAGKPAGLVRSLWVDQLAKKATEFDVAIIDVGPSFGALNRTVLLGCDYFISPLGCDLFSIIGIENIGKWLTVNRKSLHNGIQGIESEHGREALTDYDVSNDLRFASFIGYTVLQYITKSKGGVRRPTEAFERFRRRIPAVITTSLELDIPPNILEKWLDLGDVPNMYSIVPLAQFAQKPVHLLTGADGLSGAAFSQHKNYVSFLTTLTDNIERNLKALQTPLST